MMKALRNSVSGIAAKLLFGVIVVAFVVTGFSSFFTGGTPTTVVKAGNTEVSITDYRLAYQQAESGLSRQLQRRLTREEAATYGIDRQVLGQLVRDALLDEQARRVGLGLSEEKLLRLIADDPNFHDATGNFSRNQFRQLLSNVGLTENEFIRNREQAAVRSQILDAVSLGGSVPDVMKTALGLYNGERRTIDYVTLSPALVGSLADPAADVLQTYFDGKKSVYRAPEYRSIAYAVLTPDAISDPAAVTDQQIADDYAANGARFTVAEKRRVQQIVYPTPDAAKAAKAGLAAGKTFEQLVTESGRTVADAELGLVNKSQIPEKTVADAAFALPKDQVSDVVNGAFGPVLLRVTEIEPEQKQPLETVKDDIRKALALDVANNSVQQSYDAFEDARAGGSTLDEAATRAGVAIKTIAAIDRRGLGPDGTKIEGLPAEGDVLQQAFETEVGTENLPVNIGRNGYVFFDVKSIDPARDRTLDEVKAKVIADWRDSETQRLLAEKVEAFTKRIKAGESLDAIAAEAGVQKSTASAITRDSGVAELGQTATSAAFSGPAATVTAAPAADKSSQILMRVSDVVEPADPLGSVPPQQTSQLAQMMQNDLVQSYVAVLQGQFDVKINPAAIEQAKAMR